MTHIVKPEKLDWHWRVTDAGLPDAIVANGGQSVQQLAIYATDPAGNITGLASQPARLVPQPGYADRMLTKYGATGYDIARASGSVTNLTFGTTDLTHVVANERPRFSTYTRKCTMGATGTSQIRISRFTPIAADPTELAFSIDIYLESHPSEFLGAGLNPVLTFELSSSTTTAIGSNYSRWTISAVSLRQGWNTIKFRSADTVDASTYSGNLPYGVNRLADTGTGFNFATESLGYFAITFEHMENKVVHLDQIRTPAKAKSVLVIGFDANGANSSDNVFLTKVAPLLANYGIKGYCTFTDIYELLFAGGTAWQRMATLYNTWGWDVINHTWNHGATNVGRNVTLSSLVAVADVVTATCLAAHGITLGTTVRCKVYGAGVITAANGTFDMVATTTTALVYTAAGAGSGTGTGTITLTSFLSEVFATDTAENRRLWLHEVKDTSDAMKACGFARASHFLAYPNNMVPELAVLQYGCSEAGVVMGRGVRNGYTNVNELGIDNPLNMGSWEMGSGATGTTTSYLEAKIAGAISRGDHIQIYGHYIVDDTDPANAAYAPLAANGSEYPPANNGNPNPPSGSLSGTGGWWYYSQLALMLSRTIGPAMANGTLLVMTPSEYAAYMGYTR